MNSEQGFTLHKDLGYFKNHGVDVMAFDDIYPAGHQSGISIIMHGNRLATNGDIRFEQTPGQWQPTPKQVNRTLDEKNNSITTVLEYPDYDNHMKGFNPIIYPDVEMRYSVTLKGMEDSCLVTVDLEEPIPDVFSGKLCFNLELFPGSLFGKPWIMDQKQGFFPTQANGPTLTQKSNLSHSGNLPVKGESLIAKKELLAREDLGYNPIIADDIIAKPYATGHKFTVRPDDSLSRITIESLPLSSENTPEIKLYDGRMNHNNGWFVISSEIPANQKGTVLIWQIKPNVEEDWLYSPVIQVSQVGYHPSQKKIAVVEMDASDSRYHHSENAYLYQITENGPMLYMSLIPQQWGNFLRYHYLQIDFSEIKDEGLYFLEYEGQKSTMFRIADDVYDRGVWQPVLEYFLPVQMCHMRVNEKYRVWHGLCHSDDAYMADTNFQHVDGYAQGLSTLTKYKPGDKVPGLNKGGWHDAGDFDLRVESQAGECYNLSLAFEEFNVWYDVTTIDQEAQITEIHQPDGKNDILQQIEHGLLTVVGGYEALGRLYRGIISRDLRQYVLLGDPVNMTTGDGSNGRLVFTENNPARELETAAYLAASSRAMRNYNDEMADKALKIAKELFAITDDGEKEHSFSSDFGIISSNAGNSKIHAAVELWLSCHTDKEDKDTDTYKKYLLDHTAQIVASIEKIGWIVCRIVKKLGDASFEESVRKALESYKEKLVTMSKETPYGIPYRPHIWGAGWGIQALGAQYYFLHKAFPELFDTSLMENALNFVLGCHPGSNTSSFASGIGSKSTTTAYGINRVDWSFIPGGVVSGTALIRPDFPELLDFPFLWQQMEYVLGGGSSNYLFLVLAVQNIYAQEIPKIS